MDGLFINAATKAGFQTQLANGNVHNDQIAFIKDTKEIWTQGQYYPCPYTAEEIQNLISGTGEGSVTNVVEDIISGATASDFSQEVQTSLGKADTALQPADIANWAKTSNTDKIPADKLPGYVDDVIEGYLSDGQFYSDSAHTSQIDAEGGKIYIDIVSGKTYRYSGSAYVVISETLATGTTAGTAYPGDAGQALAGKVQTLEDSQLTDADIKNVIKYGQSDISGLTAEELENLEKYGVTDITGLSESELEQKEAEKNTAAGLAKVATTGSYNDLSDKPTIPTTSDINSLIDNRIAGGSADTTVITTDNLETQVENAGFAKSSDVESALSGKQNTIDDLATIRSGAALGATAIQSHQDISGKVDKVTGFTLTKYEISGNDTDGYELTITIPNA